MSTAFIHSLTLTAYRSYDRAVLDARPGMVVLMGHNGAGKTNILEAVSLLSPGRGLRRAKLAEVQKFGSPTPWSVAAVLSTPHGEQLIATGQDPNNLESDRRIVMIDGNKVGQPELNEHLAVTWLTPSMDRLWTDSPGTRRRFLDRLTAALDPAHTTRLNRYEDALAERNKLLKDGRMDDVWLSSIEHTLATEGVAVMAARRELVLGLMPHLASTVTTAGFPAPVLSLEGIENWLAEGPALLMEDRFRAELARNRRFDGAAGITSLGPHRSDLAAVHPAKEMPAALCSTGEQKALLISLILAHAELLKAQRNQPPILLLDEIGAHLDENRRETLYNQLFLLGSQVWLTGADSSLFSPLFGHVLCYEIEAGRVRETAPV